MKRKVLIFGPIGDFGGRELETGFIANAISEEYQVKVLSSSDLTQESQIFDFINPQKVVTLNQVIFNKNFWFRFLAYLSKLKSGESKSVFSFVSNSLAKKTGYRGYALKQIMTEIDNCHYIFLCAQITSNYIKEIVEYANELKKPVIFRTTTTIKKTDLDNRNWLDKITMFLHHSETNASKLKVLKNYNYQIIDQCTFKEKEMLSLSPTNKCNTLLYVGRLSEEKGIWELVRVFSQLENGLKLKIIGDGPLLKQINSLVGSSRKIEILGYLNQDEIIQQMQESDVVVIPSLEESGPLIGLEAMASARLVVSTIVGAMSERLHGMKNQFWFDIKEAESFSRVLSRILNLSSDEIKNIAEENRLRYLDNYNSERIKSQYKNAIFRLES